MADDNPKTMVDAAEIAAGLTDWERLAILSTRMEPRQMGGIGGLAWSHPELVQRGEINHPIFGSHDSLSHLGLEVRHHLEKDTRNG